MRGTVRITGCLFGVLALSGCSSPPPPRAADRFALELPSGIERDNQNLAKNWKNTQAACLAEERGLVEARDRDASRRQTTEAVLAGAAGGLALATAVYAGLSDGPSAFAVVPMTAGAAAATAPLTVMLLQDGRSPATDERLRRIEDRRELVRDAYRRLTEADRALEGTGGSAGDEHHGGRATRLEEVRRDLDTATKRIEAAEQRLTADAAGTAKGDKPKADRATEGADAARSDLAAARAEQAKVAAALEAMGKMAGEGAEGRGRRAREERLAAAHALDEALAGLAAICGEAR